MDPRPFTILSLCSGVGGLDLGLRVAQPNARTICFVEIEAFACAILAARMAENTMDPAPIWTNLKTFDGKPWRGVVDCITAGYPCQPFSVAGKQRGSEDPRHLWPDVFRVVREINPAFCFFENVGGHLRLGFEQVHDDLRSVGYRVKAGLFTAQEVGAPHKRERLFILAYAEGTGERRETGNIPETHGRPDRSLFQLTRNHGVAAGAIQTLVDNVIGTGLRLAATPDYRALGQPKEWADNWARGVESEWRAWAESTACDAANALTFAGMTALVFRSSLINGESLALPLWLDQRGASYSTTIQLVESDRLSNPAGVQDSKNLRSGIEIDSYGGAVAYHIRKTHPGDTYIGYGMESDDWLRVPVRTAFGRMRVLHIHDKERTGQHRGKPLLTSIMPMFKMLDHYERSELQAAVVNAMIAAFIETPLDGEAIGEMFGGSVEDYLAARNEWDIRLQGGSIIPVFPGDKVSPFTPSRPNSGYGQFVENVLRHIGAGLNIPFELLMKDFSKTNYSSARAALLEAWRYFNARRQWMATYWAKPVYELWLEEAINRGIIDAPDFYERRAAWTRCKWIGPGRGWVDPVKEAKAAQLRMQIGLSTLEDECASQGLDWEEVLEQLAREKAKITELGLTINDTNSIMNTSEDNTEEQQP